MSILFEHTVGIVFTLVVISIIIALWRGNMLAKREQFIRESAFPQGLLLKLIKKHPTLTLRDAQLVSKALRQYFMTYHKSKYRHVSMPSEVVDDLWHEFILYTRNYGQFCKQAFGRFFHHTPAVVLGVDKQNNAGLRRVWWYACKDENINPKDPTRLPLLFAIDAKLGIAHGKTYSLNCKDDSHLSGGDSCCVGDFSDSTVDGSTDGFGDASDGGIGGCSGGCSGGCGGGGD